MSNDEVDRLVNERAANVLATTDRNSVGVIRILADSAGTPGQEREFKDGDETLVEQGVAEWVVAPVHLPSAGRRLDANAEVSATPADGVETYPPAEPTTSARRSEARAEGAVSAHTNDGLRDALEDARTAPASVDGDAALQASLGGRGARSGPVSATSDLEADKAPESDTESGASKAPAKKANTQR